MRLGGSARVKGQGVVILPDVVTKTVSSVRIGGGGEDGDLSAQALQPAHQGPFSACGRAFVSNNSGTLSGSLKTCVCL